MAAVFVDVILPILLVAGLGGWVAARAGMPIAPLASLTFNVFSPALVFESLSDIQASASTVERVVAVVIGGFMIMAVVSLAVSWAARHDRATLAAGALCAAVANMGNMGLPIARLGFGEIGLDVAVVAFVASSVLTYSGGIVLASLARGSVRTAVGAPLKVPALWAALAALAVAATDLHVPSVIHATTGTLAGAAIPTMLVVLGLQVARNLPTLHDVRAVVTPVTLRLCLSPMVTAGMAMLIGVDGVTRNTLIALGGMPTAVNTTIIAAQYHARPELVTQVVVASTLVSTLTLTLLVSVLR